MEPESIDGICTRSRVLESASVFLHDAPMIACVCVCP